MAEGLTVLRLAEAIRDDAKEEPYRRTMATRAIAEVNRIIADVNELSQTKVQLLADRDTGRQEFVRLTAEIQTSTLKLNTMYDESKAKVTKLKCDHEAELEVERKSSEEKLARILSLEKNNAAILLQDKLMEKDNKIALLQQQHAKDTDELNNLVRENEEENQRLQSEIQRLQSEAAAKEDAVKKAEADAARKLKKAEAEAVKKAETALTEAKKAADVAKQEMESTKLKMIDENKKKRYFEEQVETLTVDLENERLAKKQLLQFGAVKDKVLDELQKNINVFFQSAKEHSFACVVENMKLDPQLEGIDLTFPQITSVSSSISAP